MILREIVKKMIFHILGEDLNNSISNLYLRVKDFDGTEHMFNTRGEENPDSTYYLIRRKRGEEGLLSIFIYIMGRVDFADRNGMIPVVDVDLKDEPSVFKRYFVPRNNLSKADIRQCKNVLLSGYDCKPVYPGWCNWINTDFNKEKKELFDKYFDFTPEVKRAVEDARKEIHPENCLGLYLRGTDYISTKPLGHPIQPSVEDVKQYIDLFLREEGLEQIYLVTEDYNIYNQVKRIYGKKVITIKEDYYVENYKSGETVLKSLRRSGDLEEKNLLYLVKIILLSQCHSFVGGRTNGSSVANAFNGGKYKRKFVYNKGLYE